MYITNTMLPHERKSVIADGVADSQKTYTFYEYQNKLRELPIIRLGITVPIYRMANYRTRTEQLKYIRNNDVAKDYFAGGEENELVQQAQHDLLVDFAKRGSDSISPIMNELEVEEQREPLLITDRGVVVNGNRRLAAIRELFTNDPEHYRRYSHVDCAVLPGDATTRDIREVEVRLQMRPETKLPYGWIEESLAIREMIDSGMGLDYVSALMKKKPKAIEQADRALTEVNIYLKAWLDKPEEYQYVENTEQFFNDLAKSFSGVEGDILEAKRRIAWALISAPRKSLKRRRYDYNFSFDKKADEVIKGLSERLDIDLSPSTSEESDDLDIELDEPNSEATVSLNAFIDAFDDKDQIESITKELVDVCEEIRELDRQESIGNQALDAVKAANSKLMSVDISKADVNTYEKIAAQLKSVKSRAEALQHTLEPYIKASLAGVAENSDE